MKLTILTLTLLSALAYSQTAVKTLKVLTIVETDPGRLLPPPVADGSDVQKSEMAEVERMVKTRTPERYAQAVWDNNHEDATAFASVIGPAFDLKKLPATAKYLALVLNDQSVIASASKSVLSPAVSLLLRQSRQLQGMEL